MRRRIRPLTFAAVFAVTGVALALNSADAPDSRINLASGSIETVDTPWSGSNYNVRHVISPNGGNCLIVTTLTTDSRDDLGARLVINSSTGDSWVAWWRDAATDQVIVRKRSSGSGTWTPERVQSGTSESGRHPSVAFDGSSPWVAYEADGANGSTVLETKVIEDDPAPFGMAVAVGTTNYTGKIDALLQAESGRLWLSWVDSASQVGWSRYDRTTGMWSVPAYESYALDTVIAARARIRAIVLGN